LLSVKFTDNEKFTSKIVLVTAPTQDTSNVIVALFWSNLKHVEAGVVVKFEVTTSD